MEDDSWSSYKTKRFHVNLIKTVSNLLVMLSFLGEILTIKINAFTKKR